MSGHHESSGGGLNFLRDVMGFSMRAIVGTGDPTNTDIKDHIENIKIKPQGGGGGGHHGGRGH